MSWLKLFMSQVLECYVLDASCNCGLFGSWAILEVDRHADSFFAFMYEGCSKNSVFCIGAHIAGVLLFILIFCSALQNTLCQPEHTFLAGQSIFGSIFHTLQWGQPSDKIVDSRWKE